METNAGGRKGLAQKGEGSLGAFSQRWAVRDPFLLAAPTVPRRAGEVLVGEGLSGMTLEVDPKQGIPPLGPACQPLNASPLQFSSWYASLSGIVFFSHVLMFMAHPSLLKCQLPEGRHQLWAA